MILESNNKMKRRRLWKWKILTFGGGYGVLIMGIIESNWCRIIGGTGLLLIFIFDGFNDVHF